MATGTTVRASARRRGRRRSGSHGPAVSPAAWRRLAACTAAAALLQLDGTLITVALPAMGHGLGVSSASTSIVLSAYFGAYAIVLLPGGELVDRLGARRLALSGLALFALGAALGAVAPSLGLLVLTRVLQGAGAGLVSPAALAGAVSGFPPERRGSALGIWGASAGVANLLGPLLGGLLTFALGWRANWWALVPLALLAGWAIVRHVPRMVDAEDAASPVGEAHALEVARARGGQAVAAAPAHARVARAPVLAGAGAVVAAATFVAALTFAVMIGCFYLAEQYLQRVAGYSALGASSVLVVVALLVGAAAPLAGRLVDRHGERMPAVAGFLAAGIGLGVLGIRGVSLHSLASAPLLIPVGIGLGMLFVPTSRAALNATPMSLHGRTSAVLSVGRLVGAALGAGLAGAALSGGPSAATVHDALLAGCAICLLLGIPAAMRLRPAAARAEVAAAGDASTA
jgi:MFS family permease